MKQIELLIYVLIVVFVLFLMVKYWKTGRKE
jgi:hypothetical protein